VRRLAALAITVALAWLVVARMSEEGASSAALSLGVALIAAAIVGWLFEFLHLPRITGYLIFGLLCGPSVANIIRESMARDLRVANGLAIVVIGFIAGLELNFSRLRARLATIATIGSLTIAVAWIGMVVVLYAVWPWLPIGPELTGATRLAAAALTATVLVGFSPTVTIAVIAESRARGPLAELAVPLVVLADLAVILLFALCMEGARLAFESGGPTGLVFLASTSWEIFGSLAFGAIVGSLFALYLRYVGREVTLVLFALCMILALGAGWHFNPLLASLAAGVVVQNIATPVGDVLRDAIERGAMPILVLFFAAAGASFHLEALATIGATALAISAVRLVLVRAGTRIGARVANVDTPESRLLWRALMTKAGVALGLAVLAANAYPEWGGRLETLTVAAIALHDLVGPILFKSALVQMREIGRAGSGLVVVSNREPWMHEYAPDGSIQVRPTTGGVSVALDALMRERGGVWVAHGAGSADRAVVDDRSSIEVPPEAPAYRLRRLWLTQQEEEGYYAGFSNSALWPLCHQAHVRPVFRAEDWDVYQSVNRRFAEAAALEAPTDSSVFLNDYHLALVARYLRARRPLHRIALFWHIPWPDPERLRICPWRKEILEGLLSNDLLAFQLPRDQRNFLLAVADEIGASVSGDVVHFGDRPVRVVAIPIGADFDRIQAILADERLTRAMRRLSQQLGLEGEGHIVGVGVDRLDYTKGIPERIAAIDRLLEARQDLRGRFTFVQIGVPSRTDVPAYADIGAEIDDQVARVNARHGRGPDDGPIRYLKQPFELPELVALYRLASFCIVSSLHDGMNLVAKEFVAARDDLDGVLILSELAGASQELAEALIINPYDERGFAAAVERAIEMPGWERRRRMQALRRRVAGRDVLAWASDILDRLERRKGLGFLSG
jgi:alpha,alpha-trehalose-phosphate synthase [UDP-forming]